MKIYSNVHVNFIVLNQSITSVETVLYFMRLGVRTLCGKIRLSLFYFSA